MLVESTAAKPLESDRLYADVIVPRHLAGPFTYLVPTQLKTVVRIGHLVCVPFGRSMVQGAVIALTRTHPPAQVRERLKEIRTLVTDGHAIEIPPHLFQLARLVAESYVAPWGQSLRLVLPPIGPGKIDRSRIILTKEGREALMARQIDSAEALSLLRRLKRRPLGIQISTLQRSRDPHHEEVLAALIDREWVQKILAPAASRDLKSKQLSEHPVRDVVPTRSDVNENGGSYPQEWEGQFDQALEKGQAACLLLQAPPQERLALLRHAVRRTVNLGRKALVIVGEAERAESLAATLAHDHAIVTACLHSGVPNDEKAEMWEQIHQDRVSVVVGTRSALFLPLHNIGLIWIDREEDPALKEPQEPRYHARDVGRMRAHDEQALLVMASSHLMLETISMEPRENLLQAPLWPAGMPSVEVVDLRGHNRATVLSPLLCDAMRETIDRQAGVLLFLNRKGYAGALVCRDCGWVPRCASCAVAFTYSRQKRSLLCHYCGVVNPIPDLCPDCGGSRLQPIGEGTERVEEEARRRFPSASVIRVDGETMRSPKQAAAIWRRVQRREWDVLVGTQLLLRADLVSPVGLVGAVQADAGLNLPDFRAAERTYHFLHDAVGLAQPLSAGGRIILQTYLPSHHTIQAVVQRNEAIFQSEEMAHRTALGFPPALHLIVLHVTGPQEQAVERAAQSWAARLSRIGEKQAPQRMADHADSLTVLGPALSPVPRLRGRYRRQILVKSRSREAAVQILRATLTELEKAYPHRKVKFDVDVDPVDMW